MEEARKLFRDKERTEFVIVTIPTVMAVAESERLATSLESEEVPVKRILINQLVRTRKLCCLRLVLHDHLIVLSGIAAFVTFSVVTSTPDGASSSSEQSWLASAG